MSVERRDNMRLEIGAKGLFDLRAVDDGRRLVIEKQFEATSSEVKDLLRMVMTAHLIGPFFPRVIETNYEIKYGEFIDRLYRYYGYEPPVIRKSETVLRLKHDSNEKMSEAEVSVASAHSGGLDSLYRLALLVSNFEKPLGVHLRNLNGKNNYGEFVASEKQASSLNVPLEVVRLVNNSKNKGFDTMRTRDFLLGLVTAMCVFERGGDRVLIEGGMIDDPSKSHFSENSEGWIFFNRLMREAGLNVAVDGIDPGDVETVAEVVRLEKVLGVDLIREVQNCFSAPYQIGFLRKKWFRETPLIASSSSEHWCGSCLKCRRMTLGRLVYEDPKIKFDRKEILYFVRDTWSWLRKYKHNGEMVSASFLEHLRRLEKSC